MVLEKKLIRMTILAENKNKKILSSALIDCGSITGSQWIALAQVYSTVQYNGRSQCWTVRSKLHCLKF